MNRTLIGIILLSTVVRLWYLAYTGWTVELKPDSQGYYLEQGFYTDKLLTNFFNPHRTPGYAMITAPFMHNLPVYGSQSFIDQARIVIVFQTALGIASLLFLYDTLLALGISTRFSLLFTALTSVNIYQFIWDRAFLTESLYISFLIVLMRLFVALLRKPTVPTGILFMCISWFLFLLRPAGLLIPFILLPFVKKTKLVLFLLLLYSLLPASFLIMNQRLHNFRGISYNTDFGIFGRILLYNIPIDTAKEVPNLYQKVNEYRAIGGNVSIPWYFFVYYGNEVYGKLSEVQEFNKLVIKGHAMEFARSVFLDIPKAFFDTDVQGVLHQSPSPGISRVFFDILDKMMQIMQKSTIVFFVFVIPTVYLFIKKQSNLHTFLLAIAVMELYQLIASLTFGGAWEFARHMLTTQTFLFFFCFFWIYKLWPRR